MPINRYLNIFLYSTLVIFNGSQTAFAQEPLPNIKLPPGFKIAVYAGKRTKNGENLRGARFMTFDSTGNLFVSSAEGNKVLMVIDNDKNGIADEVITVAQDLNAPQGLAFIGNDLLVANEDGVVKLEKNTSPVASQSASQNIRQDANLPWAAKISPFIKNLPTGGHKLKTIKLSPDGYLYINVGSSCNVCDETDPLRATILRYTKEGKPAGALTTLGRHQQSAIWARGLRNSQGFAWHPVTNDMYATNNGSDNRSLTKNGAVNDEYPPEHLNKILAAKHYGWPHCWGNQVEDPNFAAPQTGMGEAGFCKTTQPPEITFTSHSTPIGITFLDKSNFPADYRKDAIVALHGSWNRKTPSGYKLVRVKFKNNQPVEVEDFATGWLAGSNVLGRPVDVAVGTDGALYVSDDTAGLIYRITYAANG